MRAAVLFVALTLVPLTGCASRGRGTTPAQSAQTSADDGQKAPGAWQPAPSGTERPAPPTGDGAGGRPVREGKAAAGVTCGKKQCAPGEVCCNPSCGICTPPGGMCTQQVCE